MASEVYFLLKFIPHFKYSLLQGKKVLVIGTTSEVNFLRMVGICDSFSVTYHVPTLGKEDARKVIIVLFLLFTSYHNFINSFSQFVCTRSIFSEHGCNEFCDQIVFPFSKSRAGDYTSCTT